MIITILLVFAFVFALLAALGVSGQRVQFGWLSIALFLLAEVIMRFGGVR